MCCSCASYLIKSYLYFSLQINIGINVAVKKDINSKDWDIKVGNNSIGNIIPTNKLFEKSGAGNRRNPTINPTIIEAYAVFFSNFLL